MIFGNTKILILALLVFSIILAVIYLLVATKRPSQITPTPKILPKPTFSPAIFPTIAPIPTTNPNVIYEPDATNKLLDKVQNRKALSPEDQAVRDRLIESLGNKSGILNQTENYRLEYVKAPDQFMGEILTTNVDPAKQEVANWLKEQGLSSEGICNLPLVFYLNYQVSSQLRGPNYQFSPLPEGC